MKVLKRFFAICLCFVISLSCLPIAMASNSNALTLEQYDKMVSEGIIGEGVTFEKLQEFYSQSFQLEAALENNKDFYSVPFSETTIQPGDILVTNGTSSSGLTGHAGIISPSGFVINLPGKNSSTVIKNESLASFAKTYKDGWIKVYKPVISNNGTKASQWAYNQYINGTVKKYEINLDPYDISNNYCSKFVYQSYYYGAGTNSLNRTAGTWDIISPYALCDIINSSLRVEY